MGGIAQGIERPADGGIDSGKRPSALARFQVDAEADQSFVSGATKNQRTLDQRQRDHHHRGELFDWTGPGHRGNHVIDRPDESASRSRA